MSDREHPKENVGDAAHTIVKAGLSAIPVIGGPAAELFSALIIPPLTKRRDEWVQSIADGLKTLEAKMDGFSVESLSSNAAFVTVTMHATQVALRTHHQEKREALRGAVLNVASGNAPNDDVQLMFLNFVDTLTPWHLRLLRFFNDPVCYASTRGITFPNCTMGAPTTLIEHTFGELRGQRAFYDQAARDLFIRGLLVSDADALHTMMTASGMIAKRTTAMGDAFLTFITSPA